MSDLKCPSCGYRMTPITADQTVHPGCYCEHGYVGRAQCPMCRRQDEKSREWVRGYKADYIAEHGEKPAEGSMEEVLPAGVKIARNASETSRNAAKGVLPKAGSQKHMILMLIRQAGENGMTDDEIADATGMDGNTVRPRRGELAEDGLILVLRGRTRKSRRGNDAQVWIAA